MLTAHFRCAECERFKFLFVIIENEEQSSKILFLVRSLLLRFQLPAIFRCAA